jgi:hypothetical protein
MLEKSFESSLTYIRKKLSTEPIEVAKAVICQAQADFEVRKSVDIKLSAEKIAKELYESELIYVQIQQKIKEALLHIEFNFYDERAIHLAALELIALNIKALQIQKESEFNEQLIQAKTKIELLRVEKMNLDVKMQDGYKLVCGN